jgi:hypothetical protein
MADEEEEEGPVVELGEGKPVKGVPLEQVTARLYFSIELSEVERREGDTVIRTPDGPRELGDVLAEVGETYFPARRDLKMAVEAVVGTGPVPTAEE